MQDNGFALGEKLKLFLLMSKPSVMLRITPTVSFAEKPSSCVLVFAIVLKAFSLFSIDAQADVGFAVQNIDSGFARVPPYSGHQ
ncbi:MAG: hypothetical protein WBF77_10600 [Sulfurimonadaceae bacterium]